ncbi:hypothetical protein DUNSADRAFT_8562 [Dunaliella salina]|uniref:Encoded protein n=1 Tax=Dunaliella salina TaxID=3046 RepID=A0ABQ7GJ95_DUNSA|nr:hypothetical protein DUNSADRAFT_8562 [Dunaliella salina]|eukprot:KAF5834680.1 hypothetical protein DUNSADRAFT_8562 [Dunaliella salina]
MIHLLAQHYNVRNCMSMLCAAVVRASGSRSYAYIFPGIQIFYCFGAHFLIVLRNFVFSLLSSQLHSADWAPQDFGEHEQ